MRKKQNYEPPDGGYGYLIVVSLIIVSTLGASSLETFGLVYGPFLSTLGNEGQISSTICSALTFMYFFSALPANILLQKLSVRKVAFIASFFYVSGGCLTIFASTVPHLVVTMSVCQGFGWGLAQSTIATCIGDYFQAKRSFAINLALAIVSLFNAASPSLSYLIMEQYSYRGTLLILSAINMHVIFAALVLHPVKWHVKRKLSPIEIAAAKDKSEESNLLLKTAMRDDQKDGVLPKTSAWKKCKKVCSSIYRLLDLELFKMPVFVNITIGTSLSITGDALFSVLLPWILKSSEYLADEVIVLITVYYASDIFGKIMICFLVRIVPIRCRTLQLVGAYTICALRLVLMFRTSFWWTAMICALIGATRCLIQNTGFLTIAEAFPNRIMTAFTLSTVVNGFVMLILGYVIGQIVSITEKTSILLLTFALPSAIHAVIWTVELYVSRKNRTPKVIATNT